MEYEVWYSCMEYGILVEPEHQRTFKSSIQSIACPISQCSVPCFSVEKLLDNTEDGNVHSPTIKPVDSKSQKFRQ